MAGSYANPYTSGEGGITSNAYFPDNEIKINTIEESLIVLGMPSLLQDLDESLEHVRRNKKTGEQHRQFLKWADKKLLKLSLSLHPDQAMNRGESGHQIADAQKLQTALNATRTVLTILTDAFLKYIDIDYKYEYFAKLEISSMLNENERDHQINNVLFKISELSEIKRLKIVGEIRNFLIKCRKCIGSYLDRNKHEFKKYRDYALLHLQKCIEGYKNIAVECALLKEECRDENEENVKSVIQKIADQSNRESIILRDLQRVAESSLEGTFQVFSIYGPTDEYEYFILPFVYYVNVLLMCSVILDKKTNFKFNFFQNYTTITPRFEKESYLFFNAYYLASNYNNKTRCLQEVAQILLKKYPAVTKDNIVIEFDKTLRKIDTLLEAEFKIETYNEGKSNRELFYEKLLTVNDKLAEIQSVEKNLQEKIRLYKKENEDIETEHYEITKRTEEIELEKQKNVSQYKKNSEEIAQSISNCNEDATSSKQFFLSENHEIEIKSCNDMEVILERSLEKYKIIAQDFSEFLEDCERNINEQRPMFQKASSENWNKYPLVVSEEVKKNIQVNLKLNKKLSKQLSKLLTSTQNTTEKTQSESREILVKDQRFEEADIEGTVDKKKESVDPCSNNFFDSFKRNVTENSEESENQNQNSLMNSEFRMESKSEEIKNEMQQDVSTCGPRCECLSCKQISTESTKLFQSENPDISLKRLKVEGADCKEVDDKTNGTLKENARMHQSRSQDILIKSDRGSKKSSKHLKDKIKKNSGSLICDSCKLHTSKKSKTSKKGNQEISIKRDRSIEDGSVEINEEIKRMLEKNESLRSNFSKCLYGETSKAENILPKNENQENLIKSDNTAEHDGKAVKDNIQQNKSESFSKCLSCDQIIPKNTRVLQTQSQETLVDGNQTMEKDGTGIDNKMKVE